MHTCQQTPKLPLPRTSNSTIAKPIPLFEPVTSQVLDIPNETGILSSLRVSVFILDFLLPLSPRAFDRLSSKEAAANRSCILGLPPGPTRSDESNEFMERSAGYREMSSEISPKMIVRSGVGTPSDRVQRGLTGGGSWAKDFLFLSRMTRPTFGIGVLRYRQLSVPS